MSNVIELEFESAVAAAPLDVWKSVTTLRGVNDELGPWLRMTGPQDLRLDEAAWRSGALELSSWVLGLGVVPFDRHRFRFTEVIDGEGFREDSSSWLHSRWQHARTVHPRANGTGSLIVDRLVIEPRFSITRGLIRNIVSVVFGHRHRRLRARYGCVVARVEAAGLEP